MSKNNKPVFKESKNLATAQAIKRPVVSMTPLVMAHDIPPGTNMTFVDIVHSFASIDVESKFNKFSALIDTANEWLSRNGQWKVMSCETVSLVFSTETHESGATRSQLQTHIDYDSDGFRVMRGLRLWISVCDHVLEPFVNHKNNIQIIGYQTFVPKICQYFDEHIGWEQLDDVVQAINRAIIGGQIKGRLLNIESVHYDADDDWQVDTECPKPHEIIDKQMMCLRVFYSLNTEQTRPVEEISIFDFIPELILANTVPPKFEPFNALIMKVQEFLDDNQEFGFLNVQTLDIRYRNVEEIQTHFMANVNDIGFYLRCLRLVCTRPPAPPVIDCQPRPLNKQHSIYDQKSELSVLPVVPELPNEHLDELSSDANIQVIKNNVNDSEGHKDLVTVRLLHPPVLNLVSHYILIENYHDLHGCHYMAKRELDAFMERDEWCHSTTSHPNLSWTYLCAETVAVLARNNQEIDSKADLTLYTTKHSLLQMPKLFYVLRIYFDTRVESSGDFSGSGKSVRRKRSMLRMFSLGSSTDRTQTDRQSQWYRRRTQSDGRLVQSIDTLPEDNGQPSNGTEPVDSDGPNQTARRSISCVML